MTRRLVSGHTLDRIASSIVRFGNLLVVAFLFIPILFALAMAFDSRTYAAYFPPAGFSLDWFWRFLTNRQFVEGMATSLKVVILATLFSLGMGIPSSLALVRYDFRGKGFLNTLILSPIVVPGIVTGTALVTMFYSLRMYNAFPGLVVGHLIITLPYVVRTISASLIGFDRSVEEAAQILGANEIQTFARITLPIIKPGVVAAAVFAFSISWGDLAVAAFMTDPWTFTLPVAMMNFLRYNFDNTVAAGSAFLTGVTALTIILIERWIGLERFTGLW